MELKDVFTIVGKPGLYRYVANATHGLIMESLIDGKRLKVDMSANVSTLAEIAIYTTEGEFPLWKVFNAMRDHHDEVYAIDKSTPKDTVVALFAKVLPNYDANRVYESNMRKAFRWFVLLTDKGMTDFTVKDPEGDSTTADSGTTPNN